MWCKGSHLNGNGDISTIILVIILSIPPWLVLSPTTSRRLVVASARIRPPELDLGSSILCVRDELIRH
jgi:hypothetical protein